MHPPLVLPMCLVSDLIVIHCTTLISVLAVSQVVVLQSVAVLVGPSAAAKCFRALSFFLCLVIVTYPDKSMSALFSCAYRRIITSHIRMGFPRAFIFLKQGPALP